MEEKKRTEALILWLKGRRDVATKRIKPYTNAEAAEAMGIGDMKKFGRAHGNIQSRLDYACYKLGLPPLGLTAQTPLPGRKPWDWSN